MYHVVIDRGTRQFVCAICYSLYEAQLNQKAWQETVKFADVQIVEAR
jgi:hypothetical protein